MKRIASTTTKMVVIWLGASLIIGGFYLHLSDKAYQLLVARLTTENQQMLSYVDTRASRIQNNLNNTFHELYSSSLIKDFAGTNRPDLKRYIENQWALVAVNSSYFYQLRYLNAQGEEKIRVEINNNTNKPYVVPDAELQDKSHRDYVAYARSLPNDTTGFVGVDIEYEHGRPVLPYLPGYRMIHPITNQEQRYGYFIANLDVLSIVRELTTHERNQDIDFINDLGFYRLSNQSNKLFGDLIAERYHYNLRSENTDLWRAIQAAPSRQGYYMSSMGLYVFKPLDSTLFMSKSPLIMLTHVPHQQIQNLFDKQLVAMEKEALIIWLFAGMLSGILAMVWDAKQRELLDQKFAELVLSSGTAIVITDAKHRIIRATSRFCEIVEKESPEIINANIFKFTLDPKQAKNIEQELHIAENWKGQMTFLTSSGQQRICQSEISSSPMRWNRMRHYVYSITDISEQYERIKQLKSQTERDPATELWNKGKFHTVLDHYSKLYQRYPDQPPSCLAIIDIDNFKNINDSQGHSVGDRIILYVADKLTALLRDTDFIARIGGDEFAVIIQHADTDKAALLMRRVCQTIASSEAYSLTVSIGIAQIELNSEHTFSHADEALYRSKAKGKNCVTIHGKEQLHIIKTQFSD
ncbi:PAS domain S-box-containing protein/diguanylate cyclase (GGDEF) domain-containing protein [Vibrio xiamenensis]|uniref:diguanylate cyclase n=1 Tax=Vibrio xiamenensis TaxID=861298 RepID=A0A1G8BHM2_9VIBR|nr:sensor domain-containing diguanylate cyclase [Vibrio xiamenensis]SDH32717.1 PAS domain S-box-containing protein/diguanylate cyclase (GGDEF) domain-containing protein [Vibrio xiamenensis]